MTFRRHRRLRRCCVWESRNRRLRPRRRDRALRRVRAGARSAGWPRIASAAIYRCCATAGQSPFKGAKEETMNVRPAARRADQLSELRVAEEMHTGVFATPLDTPLREVA